jgi:hypothetical protein
VAGGVGTYFIVKAHDDQSDANNALTAFQSSQQPGGPCLPGGGRGALAPKLPGRI